MGMINNKWFQAGIVLIISNFFTPLGDSAVGAVGFLGMLFVFVPKLREIARLDNLIKVKQTSKQAAKQAPKQTNAKTSTKDGVSLSSVNLNLDDETIAKLESQDTWLRYSKARWEGADMSYPDWYAEAQRNCEEEGWKFFSSHQADIEASKARKAIVAKEFDLDIYDLIDPKKDWIDGAVKAYLIRAQAMQSFEKKYKKS